MDTIAYATEEGLAWLQQHDPHIEAEALQSKIPRKEVIVARHEGQIVGWLRFGMFWDTIPFMILLFVLEGHRGRGIGTELVRFWEAEMRNRGYDRVMTSSTSSKRGQHLYRKLGYTDIGGFVIPGEPLELMFHKSVR